MPLKIDLKPSEKMILNGAVISGGKKGASIIIENKVMLLRGKDILRPEEVNTPVRHIYFQIMLLYIDDDNTDTYLDNYNLRLNEIKGVIKSKDMVAGVAEIEALVADKQYYQALKACQKLMVLEEKVLGYLNSPEWLEPVAAAKKAKARRKALDVSDEASEK